VEIIKMKDRELYAQMCQKIIDMTMSRLYNDLDKDQASRMRATLMENLRNMKTNEMMTFLKEAYLEHENVINSLKCEIPPHHPRFPQQRVIINYSLSPGAKYKPRIYNGEPNIMLPAQKSVTLSPAEWKIMDTKIRFFIPRDHYGQLKSRQSSKMLEISIFPGILSNDNSNTIKLMVKNYGNSKTEVTEGDYIADLLIAPVLHPVLFPISTIEMVSKKGLDAQDCLKGEISRDLKVERLEDAIVEPHPKSKLDYSEMTLLNTIILDKKKGRSVDFPDYLERENQKDNHHHPSEFSPVELTQVPSYPPDFEKTIKFEMPASSDAMTLKNGRLLASHSQKTAKLYYSLEKPYDLHPRSAYNSPGIDLPI
jgi:dUTPase